MSRVRVPIFNTPGKSITVDPGATVGAVVGVNLFLQDGTVVTKEMLFEPAAPSEPDLPFTYWRLVREVPANVVALAEAGGAGLFAVTGSGTGAFREIQPAIGRTTVSNGDGVSGNPVVDLAVVVDSGVGAALVKITRDGWGRVTGTEAATTDDLPEGSINLYFPEAPEDGQQYVRQEGAWEVAEIGALLDYLPDPASSANADLYDTLVALLADLQAKGWMAGPPPAVPVNTVLPAITGGTTTGDLLTLSDGTWTESPTSYAYQWQELIAAVWTDIVGETGNTYLTDHDGEYRGEVIATNGVGDSLPAYSASHTTGSGTLMVFGNDVALLPGDGFPGDINRSIYSIFTKANSGPVTGVFSRFRSDTSAGGNAKVLIYSVVSGDPDALLFESDAEVIPAGGGLVSFGITGDISGVTPAADYALVVVADGFQVQFGKQNTSGTTYRKEGITFASPPDPFPLPADDSYLGDTAVWCEYLG